MDTLAIGIIGVGGMGSFHARTLAALSGVRVTAVSDPYEPNARAIHDELGAEIVTDPLALAASPEIDGLVIASPDDTHAELAIAALGQATPTLCEKPLATNATDARMVVDAEIATGRRIIQLGFMREYDPAHRQVMAELATLGQIDAVRAVHRNANDTPRPLVQIVGQSLVHDIHSVHFMTGEEIVAVHASGSGAANGSFRHVVVLCTLSSGAHAVLEFDDGGFAYEVSVEVLTATGDALTGLPTRAIRRRNGSIDVHLGIDWFGWFAEAYRLQDQAWVNSITSGVATGPTTWDGLRAQIVVDAIITSIESGQTVEVPAQDRPLLFG